MSSKMLSPASPKALLNAPPLKLALAGNPNSGKTTLFNQLTGSQQHVGNWPGVTVEKKEGAIKTDSSVILVDLPGIYSLSPYTPEEIISRNYLINEKPDAIINIVDATNIERNLYLTTQLIELGIPTVIALNMIDIVQKSGELINIEALSLAFGCPVVEISALRDIGSQELTTVATALAKGEKTSCRVHRFSDGVEDTLAAIEREIQGYVQEDNIRWFGVKYFEGDREILKHSTVPKENLGNILTITQEREVLEDDDAPSIIANERYSYIGSAIHGKVINRKPHQDTISDKIDSIVTSRYLALPIFAAVMFFVYYLAISTVGTGLTDAVNGFFEETLPVFLSGKFDLWSVKPWISSLVLDGILAGVGAVLGFLPQMMVLFFLLAILEDVGYMSRIAFIMDKLFRRFGLSGKSFIPMLITTGCGVPGIMAARTIESERDRKMTIMTTTFIPCSAKLPVIALIAGSFFKDSWWIAPSIYFIGIAAVIVSGVILKKTRLFHGDPSPFVMELPSYHLPNFKGLLRTVWDKSKSFVTNAGSVIFVSACVIWFLSNFNWNLQMVDTEVSILAALGNGLAPVFRPLGWGDWKSAVATVTGLVAKENVVSTLGILHGFAEVSENGYEIQSTLAATLSPLAGYSFLVFNMLCAPCFAAIGALKKELGTKWMWISLTFQTGLAYVVAFCIYQVGVFAGTATFTAATGAAFVAIGVILFLLLRPMPNWEKKLKNKQSKAAHAL